MAGEQTAVTRGPVHLGKWLTGAGAGAVGAAIASGILIAMGTTALAELAAGSLGVLLVPGAVFGLVYVPIASVPTGSRLATEPRTGFRWDWVTASSSE